MSRNSSKKKKSTSKYRKFKISPLIPIIAIIEVIVLVAISTYAWFAVSKDKEANTGIITVDADSGLDIEFKNANYDDSINLWDYVPDDFEFSPVSSLDGRNVFVPTSGTFDGEVTDSIKFREGTVNDINTKYINVDFMLTNQTDHDVNVYLNDNSHFNVYSGGSHSSSRALRLAFYTNDGRHGNVSSTILSNTNQENAAIDKMDKTVTVYFNKPTTNKWANSDAYAYIWKSSASDVAVSWPGSKMTHVAGNVYSYTFSNKTGYTNIIFNNGDSTGVPYTGSNGSTYNQTRNLSLSYNSSTGETGANGKIFEATAAAGNTGTTYNTKTVYFRKPLDWSGVRAHAFYATGDTRSFTDWPGDYCKDCGADVYSYTFPVTANVNGTNLNMNKIVFNNSANSNNKSADLDAVDGRLYYFNSSGNGACSYATYSESKVYFYNDIPQGGTWGKPYAVVTTNTGHETRVPMTNLSAGVYYATVPSIYETVKFEDRTDYSNNTTAVSTQYKFTQTAPVVDGNIYRPQSTPWPSSGWTLDPYSYTGYVGNGENTYAVISPGVSAGFQRSYTPVVGVTPTSGQASQVVPAFACSIDNYFKGSENPIFTIPQGAMLDLSMIIWLEGTDADCTSSNYASTASLLKDIDLKLEFSTNIAGMEREVDQVTNYTYRFYDKTREVWTSDRLTNDAGVSVAPVMQLYDATQHRGYLMHAASTTYINGKRKIDLWECSANSNLYTDPANHDLYFRRVDPYNEDEVWNYWHPVAANQCNDAAKQTVNGVTYINFTAFSDGAPASAAESGIAGNTSALSAATNAGTPNRSCGGLWGKYETQLLTVIDGSDGHWLMNDQGALCIKYTYNYGNSKTQAIEYKASGPILAGQVYYFVVPKDIVASSSYTSFTFHRFWGFDNSYAMNIKHRNENMNFDTGGSGTFTVSTQMKLYAYIAPYLSTKMWFNDAINYYNISYRNEGNNKDMFGGTKYYVDFHTGGTEQKIRLYSVAGECSLDGFNGYLVVAPPGLSKYQLRHCDNNFNTVYNYGDNVDVTNRNAVAYYWNGDAVGGVYNNNQNSYGWPKIPSVE